MVDISIETVEQTETRLRQVMKRARLKCFEAPYRFTEFPLADPLSAADGRALAVVRDENSWSQLVPHEGGEEESFGLFSFHFPAGLDNSGFVGWLATHLKRRFGTGVLVVCGYSRENGGVYDYWGVPWSAAQEVFAEVTALCDA